MKKLFCFPALELFRCLPLWKTVLFVSSRAFLLSTTTFLFSTPVEKSEATWKKATKCNKRKFDSLVINLHGIYDFAELSRNGESGGSKSNAIVVDYHPLTQWLEFHQSCRHEYTILIH